VIRLAAAAALAALALSQPRDASGITPTLVLDNATVAVTRLHVAPGAREPMHTTREPLVVVQLSAFDVAVIDREMRRLGNRPGEVWFLPGNAQHAVVNSGPNAADLLAVALKTDRAPVPVAPPTEAPPGIVRATLVDNADVRVVRVRFDPSGREPLHTHPNDLVTVQITSGRVEIVNGRERTTEVRAPGDVHFVARNVSHAYASADTAPFEILSIAIK
jgi:quercetin dioxygenase-like cupin family protein